MAMFNKKKRMQWTALLIAVVRLNTCDGEILKGEIKCWDKENAVICNTAEDCSWNPDAFPTKTGEHKCQTDSENIQCIQLSQRTCSSYTCCFSYTPFHIDLCTICWESKIECQDKKNTMICNTPNKCSWNPDVFPKKSGNYKCETVLISSVPEMHCSKTSSKTEKCDSNKDCGFTYRFPPNVICLMSLLPEITCKHNKIPKCKTPNDCTWNPDEFPSKSATHECKFDSIGDKIIKSTDAPKEPGSGPHPDSIGDKIIKSTDAPKEPGSGPHPATVPAILGILGIAIVVIGVALLYKYCKKRRATREVQNGRPVPPPSSPTGTGVPLLPDETSTV